MCATIKYPELDALLGELTERIKKVLWSNLVGAYVVGSIATGDHDEHSDVDFVIVTKKEVTDEVLSALRQLHKAIFVLDNRWARSLEGSYFPLEVLRDLRRCGEVLWYLDNGSSALELSAHCNSIVVRWVLREKGIQLAGPPAVELLGEIPVSILRQDIYSSLVDWGKQILAEPSQIGTRFFQGFAVLSYCRMLRDLQFGTIGSKRLGAEWARRELGARWSGLIDRAWTTRPNPVVSSREPADPRDIELTLELVRTVIDKAESFIDRPASAADSDAA